nr:hypothetical protein [Planctomycetota bacterium]
GRDRSRLRGANAATSTIETPAGGDAPTETRETTAADRQEGAAVATAAVALERLASEEEALDAETLPLARREQVLRYFTAVRASLEHGE